MGNYKKLGKNIGLMFIGNLVTKILSFFMVPLYTSVLSTAEYGIADIISTTVLLVLPIFSVLMDEAVLRFSLDKGKDIRQVFSLSIYISTMGFIIVMAISPVIFLIDSLKDYYWFVVLYYVASWLYNITSSYAKGTDRVGIYSIGGVLHSVLFIGINLLTLLVLKWGIYGYLLATSVSNLVVVVYLFFACGMQNKFISFRTVDRQLARDMIRYSTPMIPDYLTWWVNNAADRYFLLWICGEAVVGIYSVAHKIPSLLNSISTIFASAWRISSVEDFGSQESKNFYKKTFRMYSAFLLIGSACLILVTKVLAKILFANDFFIAWQITPILLLANIFSAQSIFIGSIFTASKNTKLLWVAPLIGALTNIVLNSLLIPFWGGVGAAIATTIGYCVIMIVQIINTRKILVVDFGLIGNFISYMVIVLEIFMVLWDCLYGYIIAGGCVVILFIINIKGFIDVFQKFFSRRGKI